MQKLDIHDTYINVVIPFNKDIVSQMSDGKNNGKNLLLLAKMLYNIIRGEVNVRRI